MQLYDRLYGGSFSRTISLPFVHIMFGARQTGKSTLIRSLIPSESLVFDLSNPLQRLQFAANPGQLIDIYRALPASESPHFIFLDEVQSAPELFDAVQFLYDEEKRSLPDERRTHFILCGSSARRLRRTSTNLLPGRSILHHLYPLTSIEYEPDFPPGFPGETLYGSRSVLPIFKDEPRLVSPFPKRTLEDRLIYGDLPAMAISYHERDASADPRRELLRTYVSAYIEEELHRETQIREWGPFLRFLSLAAAESGGIVNFAGIAKESGISAPTVKAHYQLLEDMFLGFMVPAFSGSPRKTVLSTPRFFFIDLGIRNAAAGLSFTPDTLLANPGPLFEQWVGIELYKRLSYRGDAQLSYFRTAGGSEVDFIIEKEGTLYPIEVKWTENPTTKDARHLEAFLHDHRDRASHGYIVCRAPYPLAVSKTVTAIPWWML
ncbi:MAG TPA: ATP-binding protein [Rectinema sp.]|nr:ATP-binding protein [Rectinema sp.]